MKLKYYLRGLGIGIIVTTIILASCFSMKKPKMTDAQIMERASQLGMIMPEQDGGVTAETEAASPEETEQENEQQMTAENLQKETETQTEVPKEQDTESQAEVQKEQETEAAENSTASENAENKEQTQQEPFTLVVNRGDVCRTMCENLAANGVIDDAEGLRKYLSEIGYASFISAGTYQIPYHASYEEITSVLKAGPMEQQKK